MICIASKFIRPSIALALTTCGLGLASSVAIARPSKPVQSQPIPQNSPAVPLPAEQVMLLQSTLAALNQANLTGDYSIFLKLAAAPFRQANDQQGLANGFKGFRDNGIDLAPVVLFPPRWIVAPGVANGMLRLVGVFDTEPQQVTFDLAYLQESGRWKVAAISVGLNAPRQTGSTGDVK